MVALALALGAVACAGAARAIAVRVSDGSRPIVRLVESGELEAGDELYLEGMVRTAPQALPGRLRLELAVSCLGVPGSWRHGVRGLVQVSIGGDQAAVERTERDIRYGDVVRLSGVLDDDLAFFNPGVEPLRTSLRRRGLDASVRSRAESVEFVGHSRGCPVVSALYAQRDAWCAFLDEHFGARNRGLLRALLLGDGSWLDAETAEIYRDSGTFHVLVISGAHIAIVAACLLWPTSRLTRGRWIRLAAGTIPVWAYSIMVGLPAPVWRAALTVTIALVARAVHRCAPPANTVAIAAIAVLAWDPRELGDPGFQLTFGAVAAIVLVAAPALDRFARAGRWAPSRAAPYPPRMSPRARVLAELLFRPAGAVTTRSHRGAVRCAPSSRSVVTQAVLGVLQRTSRYVACALWVAIVVQLALAPLSVAHFHRVTPGGALATCVVELLLGVVLVAGLAMLLVSSAWPPAAIALVPYVEAVASLATASARASPPGVFVPSPAGAGSLAAPTLVVCLIVCAIAASRYRVIPRTLAELAPAGAWARPCALVTALALAWSAAECVAPEDTPAADGRLHVVFLDVGQGDAALVRFPDGRTMLIDAGGRPQFDAPLAIEDGREVVGERFDIGERVVCQTLWTLGVGRLDFVLASHGDADHVGGFEPVLHRMPIGGAFVARSADPHLEKLRGALATSRVPVVELSAGDSFDIGGARVDALWPDDGAARGNNASLVVRISYGSRSFLFTGDVERQAERALVDGASVRRIALHSDVLKVAHHGSRTSSTDAFLATVSPRWVVISAPRVSPYGHPHADALARLARSRASIVQTGTGGAVEFVTDGTSLDARGLGADATFSAEVSTMQHPTLRAARNARERAIHQ